MKQKFSVFVLDRTEGCPQSNRNEKKSSGKIQEAKKARRRRKEKGMLWKRVERRGAIEGKDKKKM